MRPAFPAMLPADVPLSDALRKWDAKLSVTGYSDKTRRSYRRLVLNFLADTLLVERWNAITEDDVIDYLAALPAQGAMRGQYLRALKKWGEYLEDREICWNPTKELQIPEKKYGAAPTLSTEELTRLTIALAWREPRRAWTLLLLYGTGARISSVCALTPEDIHLEDPAHVNFREVKGGRPYAVPLGRLSRAAVEALLPNLVGVGPTRVRQWFDEAEQDTGIKLWPHLLRHSFATDLIARGADMRAVQELGGWSSLEMVSRYASVSDRRKREAVELLG